MHIHELLRNGHFLNRLLDGGLLSGLCGFFGSHILLLIYICVLVCERENITLDIVVLLAGIYYDRVRSKYIQWGSRTIKKDWQKS